MCQHNKPMYFTTKLFEIGISMIKPLRRWTTVWTGGFAVCSVEYSSVEVRYNLIKGATMY